jgi:hypothetical protein
VLQARADAGECDFIEKGRMGTYEMGFRYMGGGHFKTDREALPWVSSATLRAGVSANHGVLTYTPARRQAPASARASTGTWTG